MVTPLELNAVRPVACVLAAELPPLPDSTSSSCTPRLVSYTETLVDPDRESQM